MATTLVLGGTRSGKTRHARRLLQRNGSVTVLNAGGHDATNGKASEIHGPREPLHADDWTQIDTNDPTRAILRARTPVLIDCLGTWVVALLNEWNSWDDLDGSLGKAEESAYELAALWSDAPYDAVAVSHEIGMSPLPSNHHSRVYQDVLGRVNTIISEASQRTHLVVAGRVLDLSDAPLVG